MHPMLFITRPAAEQKYVRCKWQNEENAILSGLYLLIGFLWFPCSDTNRVIIVSMFMSVCLVSVSKQKTLILLCIIYKFPARPNAYFMRNHC